MSDMQSVLDMMTAGVMERKAGKAPVALTPVGQEKPVGVIPAEAPVAFPNDRPADAVNEAIIGLQRQIGVLQGVVAALQTLNGRDVEITPPPGPVDKAMTVLFEFH